MTELMHQMRSNVAASTGNIPQSVSKSNRLKPPSDAAFLQAKARFQRGLSQNAITYMADISPNNSQFFEVLYVGKIKVSSHKVPTTFIDDALPKFRAFDALKQKQLEKEREVFDIRRRMSASDSGSSENVSMASRASSIYEEVLAEDYNREDNNRVTSIPEEDKENSLPDGSAGTPPASQPMTVPNAAGSTNRHETEMSVSPSSSYNARKLRLRSASIGSLPQSSPMDQNRTMVFLLGKNDLRLVSPDRKQVLLYKEFKDIASIAQGANNPDHFGIICRETSKNIHTGEDDRDTFIAFVFKCQSEQVTDDICNSMQQVFTTLQQQKQEFEKQFPCDHCPMLFYNKLCRDLDTVSSDRKVQNIIFKFLEMLPDDEQELIVQKFMGAQPATSEKSTREKNQFLLMLVRAHCEFKQQRHVHDTAENRSEFLNHYLGGSTIFKKAKRSLTSSFDHLLKRKNSKDDKDIAMPEQIEQNQRDRSKSIDLNTNGPRFPVAEPVKSPMMDIFMKVGNSPTSPTTSHHATPAATPADKSDVNDGVTSWRQAMLNRVVTPSKINSSDVHPDVHFLFGKKHKITEDGVTQRRTKEELRDLWRMAIKQIILLSRMEKENVRLQERQNENELKKIKLDYDEIITCDKLSYERWEIFNEESRGSRISNKRDKKVLLQAIRNGVPRSKRGEIWKFLVDQHEINQAPFGAIKQFPNYNTPYKVLLKSLTEHQHAIFIDLGRTFPNHKYFKAALGVGQLSLFNLLKAYSILDPELGYCQGLGFICGILLLHCDEEEAFHLLKHLMFVRGMRTKYLPDMQEFQLQLYQLSRLIKDRQPELYQWLDQNEVSPTLYAAPWMLTVFSSQFPLGFVTRVFDLMFLESSEIIFRVVLALLEVHKEELMKQDSFEDIMSYLKLAVPNLDADKMNKVFHEVFSMDLAAKLVEFNVEYHVLQEEITTSNRYLDEIKQLKHTNHTMANELSISHSKIKELERQKKNLKSEARGIEVTCNILGEYIAEMLEQHPGIDIPEDIRRIVEQIDCNQPEPAALKQKPYVKQKSMSFIKSRSFNSGGFLKLGDVQEEAPLHHKSSEQLFRYDNVEKLKPKTLPLILADGAVQFEPTDDPMEYLKKDSSFFYRPPKEEATEAKRIHPSLTEKSSSFSMFKSKDEPTPLPKEKSVSFFFNPKDDSSSQLTEKALQSIFKSSGSEPHPKTDEQLFKTKSNASQAILAPPSHTISHRNTLLTSANQLALSELDSIDPLPNASKPNEMTAMTTPNDDTTLDPLSSCGGVPIKFNGTHKLRQLKPQHHVLHHNDVTKNQGR